MPCLFRIEVRPQLTAGDGVLDQFERADAVEEHVRTDDADRTGAIAETLVRQVPGGTVDRIERRQRMPVGPRQQRRSRQHVSAGVNRRGAVVPHPPGASKRQGRRLDEAAEGRSRQPAADAVQPVEVHLAVVHPDALHQLIAASEPEQLERELIDERQAMGHSKTSPRSCWPARISTAIACSCAESVTAPG